MKKIYVKLFTVGILLSSSSTFIYAANPWTLGAEIPPGSSEGVQLDIFTSFDPTTGQFLATWVNDGGMEGLNPFYAIYDVTSSTWTTPGTAVPKGSSSGAFGNIFNSFDPNTGQFLATWVNSVGVQVPYYAIFNGTSSSWTTGGTVIPLGMGMGASSGVFSNIVTSVDPANAIFLATWADFLTQAPYYAIYDEMSSSWAMPDQIPLGMGMGASVGAANIYTSFDPTTSQFLATWADVISPFPPYYAIYDEMSSSWTTGAAIPLMMTSSGVLSDIVTSVDPSTGLFLATWADSLTRAPYYALFNGTSWTTPAQIPLMGTSSGVLVNIVSSFDSTTGQFLATWADLTSPFLPYYAIYNGTSWTTPAQIPHGASAGADPNVLTSLDSITGQFLATWDDSASGLPFYSIGGPFTPSVLVLPPASLTVKAHINNEFGIVKEFYNLLKWPPSTTQGVMEYRIFRNGILIATVGADVFKYKDHNRKKHEFIIYGVASIDANGNQSSPITVNVE